MGMDLIAEKDSLLARLRTTNDGRWYDEISDEELLTTFAGSTVVKPYGVLTIGVPYQSGRDRSLMSNGMQPHVVPLAFDCFANDADSAFRLASILPRLLVPPEGWAPTENSTDIALIGGGSYRRREAAGRPTRFLRTVTGEMTVNMQAELPA